jgi:nitroimidazol reductase NimA-like FMN-containing flavoprotein (pyridoxamine 5'-phosphate oxidase superfamily)
MIAELTESEMESLLRRQVVGRIGCHADGLVYVVPVNYVYDAGSIYGQTGQGMKVDMMRRNPSVCFEVDQVDDIGNWQSVIGWGTYEELSGKEASDVTNRLVARLMQMVATGRSAHHYHLTGSSIRDAYTAGRGVAAIVYRIRLDRKTGRSERP